MTSSGDLISKEDQIQFRFETKAQNLHQLTGRLETASVPPLTVVRVGEWRDSANSCIARLRADFGGSALIVRSSAPGEDSSEASQAGAFESVGNVDLLEDDAVIAAFERVIQSYHERHDRIDGFEILVQPMVTDVRMSGVLFTRDLERNSPYYVVNYDRQSDRTDTVTSGSGSDHEILRIFKGVDPVSLDEDVRQVVLLARELERLTRSDALDIEFARDERGNTHLLQVRPLARTRIVSFEKMDRRISAEVARMKSFVHDKLRRQPYLHGEKGILGEMPDWNPAEIIGTHPRPLAVSLYRHIIMHSTWREARGLLGYRDPFPAQLLVVIGGRPYVDVRASFNSFLPDDLSSELSEKLIEHYLDRLREQPNLHDKVEFEIAVTCLTLDFVTQEERLRNEAGLSGEEIVEFHNALLTLTESIVKDPDDIRADLEQRVNLLETRRLGVLAAIDDVTAIPIAVEQLLADCTAYGTLPFSVLARCAFIANSFLRSLVTRGVMTEYEYSEYVESIDTVASEFVNDLRLLRTGNMSSEEFLASYGHLRPGTYDICTPTYADQPERYLALSEDADETDPTANEREGDSTPPPVLVTGRFRPDLDRLLKDAGFSFDAELLDNFIRSSIRLRESMKLEFTKNLSVALDLLADFGDFHGLSREDLSYLELDAVLSLANRSTPQDFIAELRERIDQNRHRTEVTAATNLGDLIFDDRDVEVVTLQRRKPNFTGSRRIVAPTYRLDNLSALDDTDELRGKIVLIENADPGFDWLFGMSIAGLVTKYGGAASHMAIRCSEFGLPAAIGCGEQIFSELEKAASILIDSGEQRVEAHGI